jgi:hypothetical protein
MSSHQAAMWSATDRQRGHQRGRGRLDRQHLAGHGGPPGDEGRGVGPQLRYWPAPGARRPALGGWPGRSLPPAAWLGRRSQVGPTRGPAGHRAAGPGGPGRGLVAWAQAVQAVDACRPLERSCRSSRYTPTATRPTPPVGPGAATRGGASTLTVPGHLPTILATSSPPSTRRATTSAWSAGSSATSASAARVDCPPAPGGPGHPAPAARPAAPPGPGRLAPPGLAVPVAGPVAGHGEHPGPEGPLWAATSRSEIVARPSRPARPCPTGCGGSKRQIGVAAEASDPPGLFIDWLWLTVGQRWRNRARSRGWSETGGRGDAGHAPGRRVPASQLLAQPGVLTSSSSRWPRSSRSATRRQSPGAQLVIGVGQVGPDGSRLLIPEIRCNGHYARVVGLVKAGLASVGPKEGPCAADHAPSLSAYC